MSSHGPRTQSPVSSVIRRVRITALAVFACTASAATAHAAPQSAGCAKQIAAAASATDVPQAIRERIDRGVSRASALWRLERSDDALATLDGLARLLEGPRGERIEDRPRTELTNSIRTLKHCLAGTRPGPLTWVTIAVFDEPDTPEAARGKPAGAGVFIDADGIPIGRTGPGGTLEAKLPYGSIEVHATEYPSSWGAEIVTLAPGESRAISIIMAGDKEPSEESDLVLEEAPDDILPGNAASITLKFVRDADGVRIDHIDSIELSDDRGSAGENLEPLFGVIDGVMRATDARAVFRLIAQHSGGRPLWIMASGVDGEGRRHYGDVQFQPGQFKVTITLAPPPSNPALSVSNVPVRVSIAGMDIAIRRVSDANGRFEIESLPDATISIDAHAAASGNHYYANASLTPCGDTSATVLLLNVKDLTAGVRGIDSRTPVCPPLPRR